MSLASRISPLRDAADVLWNCDHVVVVQFLRAKFAAAGHDVVHVRDGQEALLTLPVDAISIMLRARPVPPIALRVG
jgi:hypothetical protein